MTLVYKKYTKSKQISEMKYRRRYFYFFFPNVFKSCISWKGSYDSEGESSLVLWGVSNENASSVGLYTPDLGYGTCFQSKYCIYSIGTVECRIVGIVVPYFFFWDNRGRLLTWIARYCIYFSLYLSLCLSLTQF